MATETEWRSTARTVRAWRRVRHLGQEATRLACVRDALTDPDPDRRRRGCRAAATLRHRGLLDDLLERLDDEAPLVEAAAELALRRWPRADLLDWLRAALGPLERSVYRRRALDAMLRLRDSRTLPTFVALLDDAELAREARAALVRLTAHDLGPRAADWAEWVERHRHRPRACWLADALMGEGSLLRRCAARELPALLGVRTLGCHPDAPLRERARARRFILEQLEPLEPKGATGGARCPAPGPT